MVPIADSFWRVFHYGVEKGYENIDLRDLLLQESNLSKFENDYFSQDINWDRNLDLSDSPVMGDNVNNFVFSVGQEEARIVLDSEIQTCTPK